MAVGDFSLLGWILGTQLKVFLTGLAVALAVGMPLWWLTGDVRVVVTCALVVGGVGAGIWYIRYFPRVKVELDKLRAENAER